MPDFEKFVLNETPDGVVVTSREGEIHYWNPGAERLFGFAAQEAIGKRYRDIVVPAAWMEDEVAAFQRALATGRADYESVRCTKDGSLIYVAVSGRTVGNEYFLFTQKDVTTQKVQREAKLLEAKFRDLLESLPDGIVMTNTTGRVVLANTQAERLFGYGRGELRGQVIEVLLPTRFRHGHVGYRGAYTERPRTRAMGAGMELYGLRKNGEEFPVEISLSPLMTEEGTLVMSAVRDITERKRIEQVLHDKNIELEAASLAKDRFLASMSHELRTPLNAIIGFTGMMLMQLAGPLSATQEKHLKTIQSSAKHLLSLINDLLDVAKIESGKLQLAFEPVDCVAVVNQVAETLRPLAEQKGLRFRVEAPERLSFATDQRALSQIAINLANNAIKFTERGEVVMRLQLDEAGLKLAVTDTGPGIREGDQAKLFQAFSQMDDSSTKRHEGTGLGLYLSQKLAGLLHGELTLASREGEGTTFTLSLRRAERDAANAATEKNA
ncbi:MAG TPA: PAS domain S-box protein [Rhodocyclaceae bacterium]